MGKYRVSVFKTLLSSDGHAFKCLQFMIDIGRARTAQRAVEAAQCRYQRRVRIPDWKSIADIVEVKEMETLPFERPRTVRRSAYSRHPAPPLRTSAEGHRRHA